MMKDIANEFGIEGNVKEITSIGGGLINSTFLVRTEADFPDYILQKKNSSIFKDVPRMMDNIVKVTNHIRKKVEEDDGNPAREVMTVINAHDGKPFHKTDDGDYWTMSLYIPDTVTYNKADSLDLAYKGGEGIGKFQTQLSDFTEPLFPTIPGFHDMKFRFSQWDETVANDRAGRVKDLRREIEWIEARRDKIMSFWKMVEDGTLPLRVTHNDTKLSNILFDMNNNVLCVIDLDTVMSNTLLADYGDAIRTFANTGKEDDRNLDNVGINLDIYNAYTKGYLSYASRFMNEAEKELLRMGPQYITYEQIMRFLMDYIDGDIYYKTDYKEHNLVRTRAQQKLLEAMERNI